MADKQRSDHRRMATDSQLVSAVKTNIAMPKGATPPKAAPAQPVSASTSKSISAVKKG
jgi:hypothetical protein